MHFDVGELSFDTRNSYEDPAVVTMSCIYHDDIHARINKGEGA